MIWKIIMDSIRGFYFGIDKLPGKIITKEEELPDAIRDSIDNFVYDRQIPGIQQKPSANGKMVRQAGVL